VSLIVVERFLVAGRDEFKTIRFPDEGTVFEYAVSEGEFPLKMENEVNPQPQTPNPKFQPQTPNLKPQT